MATSWDLGSLGILEGPAVAYNWTARGLMPQLLPWLAILALLALKPNHGWSAWWLWLPLLCLAAGCHWLQLALQRPGLSNDIQNVFIDIPRALAFGVAALWLLAPCLSRGRRFGAFLRMLFVLAAFAVFSFVVAGGWDEGTAARITASPRNVFGGAAAWVGGGLQVALLAVLALVITAAFLLSGLVCLGRYLPFRLCLCLLGAVPPVVFAVGMAAHLLAPLASPGGVESFDFVAVGLFSAAVSLVTLLPFLALSWANLLFRERLKGLFLLKPQTPVPGLRDGENTAPAPDAPPATRA